MALCTLRLRGPAGTSTLQLPSSSTLLELRAAIFSSTSIVLERQQLRAGVPPKPLDVSKGEDATLADLNIRTGDVIVVQEGDASSMPSISAVDKARQMTQTPIHQPSPINHGSPDSTKARTLAITGSVQTGVKSTNSSAGMEQQAPKKTAAAVGSSTTLKAPQNDTPRNAKQASHSLASTSVARRPDTPQKAKSAMSQAKSWPTGDNHANVKVEGGWLVLRVVPDDNSCMFTALAICLEQDRPGISRRLREDVATAIASNPLEWSEAVLGMPPTVYRDRIRKPATWGGAIELSILSESYGVEIDSIDVQTGRVDRFGEEKGFDTQIILVYSGIHYDAITFTPLEPDTLAEYPYDLSFDQTQFNRTTDGYALAAALELCKKLHAKHYYTDTAGFALRCEICRTALKGEKEAQAHAKQTGHTSFGEY